MQHDDFDDGQDRKGEIIVMIKHKTLTRSIVNSKVIWKWKKIQGKQNTRYMKYECSWL